MPQIKSARHAAYSLLHAVYRDGAYANIAWPRLLRGAQLAENDRRFATELAYGTLRHSGQLQTIIEAAGGKRFSQIDRELRWVLLLGAYQLLYLSTPPHAAVSESVELTDTIKRGRAKGFVNAVLRKVSQHSRDEWIDQLVQQIDDRDEQLGLRMSHPAWIVHALRKALAREGAEDELEALLVAHNTPARVTAALLPGLSTRGEAEEATPYSPIGAYIAGDPRDDDRIAASTARIQDEGSQLAALVASRGLGLSPGDRVWDACSGPGGKTAVLAAEAAAAGASVVATEIQPHRAQLVEQAVAAIEAGVVKVREVGVGDFVTSAEPFERILLDAPCLGLGALRRRPEARWSKSWDDLEELSATQRRLMDQCLSVLAPGGELVYVTCSPVVEETTELIDWVLARHPDIEALDTAKVLESLTAEPIPQSAVGSAVQLWPHRHHTDAMFIQVLKRRNDSVEA